MREPDEILFQISNMADLKNILYTEGRVYRLDRTERLLFNRHLELCYPDRAPSNREMASAVWNDCYEAGTEYFCLLIQGEPVARCAVERYSTDRWEAADVRVAPSYRCRGFARHIVHYVTEYILSFEKTATCGTTPDNAAMLKVIRFLGYKQVIKNIKP